MTSTQVVKYATVSIPHAVFEMGSAEHGTRKADVEIATILKWCLVGPGITSLLAALRSLQRPNQIIIPAFGHVWTLIIFEAVTDKKYYSMLARH